MSSRDKVKDLFLEILKEENYKRSIGIFVDVLNEFIDYNIFAEKNKITNTLQFEKVIIVERNKIL